MQSQLFPISIKGILQHKGKYLLRKNERKEWELLGGKLEANETIESRLITEFLEESGIRVIMTKHAEPWLYTIGIREVLILPYHCEPIHIPSKLHDQDGGELAWFTLDEIHKLPMPKGYLDSILGKIPQASFSVTDKQQSAVVTQGFKVLVSTLIENENGEVLVHDKHDNLLPSIFLEPHYTPRIALKRLLRQLGVSANTLIHSLPSRVTNDEVCISYYLVDQDISAMNGYKMIKNTELKL